MEPRWLIGISVRTWTARTESRKDAGSVNTGSYWRDRGPGARPTALHRSGAICDYADRGRRRRFAAVATPTHLSTQNYRSGQARERYRSSISDHGIRTVA